MPCQAATYYVSASGDDANAGTSPAQAWRTPARVNAAALLPGDRVLFAGGQTFAGGLRVRRGSQGTAAQPIVFRSFGQGRAVIASGTGMGFSTRNSGGLELRNLAFVGAGRQANQTSGVKFYNDSTDAHLPHLRFDSLDVSGYRGAGLDIASWNGTSGYDNVRITNCQLHENGEAGLASYSEFPLIGHHNWYVANCQAYDNLGRTDVSGTHTGNGIMLSGVDGALIERCEAYNNGWLNASTGGGPAGIWGWCCNNLVIQHCESHHNRSGNGKDGGGFDLDGGCTNSVLQYNYSHDNQGPGYLLAQFAGAPAMHDLTVRYNVSENDARGFGGYDQGALHVWSSGDNGGIVRANFYNNTVVIAPPANGSHPKALFIMSGGISNMTFRNNVLQTSGGLEVLSTYTTTGVHLEGNCYWSGAAPLRLNWNGANYNDLAAWRAATGQEQLANGRATGLQAAPQLAAAPNFAPLSASPLRDAGLSLSAEFLINPGPYDYCNNPTPQAPTSGSIGAIESPLLSSAPSPIVLTGFTTERQVGGALLQWSTASEKNNAHFLVERSFDGITFVGVQQVLGFGNSTEPHIYNCIHQDVTQYFANSIYYRLRQVDASGAIVYSPVTILRQAFAGINGVWNLQAEPNLIHAFDHYGFVEAVPNMSLRLLNVTEGIVACAQARPNGNVLLSIVILAIGTYTWRWSNLR